MRVNLLFALLISLCLGQSSLFAEELQDSSPPRPEQPLRSTGKWLAPPPIRQRSSPVATFTRLQLYSVLGWSDRFTRA